jgi:hypothetical protein
VEGAAELLSLEKRGGADRYILPLPGTEAEGRETAEALAGMEGRTLFSLPHWCPSGEARSREDRIVHVLLNRGFSGYEANNLSHLGRLVPAGAWILAGWRLHAMNRLALLSLGARGARAVLLSPEDEGENVDSLLAAPPPPERWVYLYGRVPLLVSLLGPFPATPREVTVPGGKDRFLLSTEEGLATLRPAAPLCLARHAGRLARADTLLADLAGVPPPDRPRLLSSLRIGVDPGGTVPFNFERRLQ